MAKGFNSLLERFLVFITVTSFMLVTASLASPLFNEPAIGKIIINWVTYIVIGVSGLIFLLIQQIFAHEKIKTYLHIVVVIFYEIITVVICGLTGQMNLPYALIPFLLVEYVLEYVINNTFVYHDIFIEECGNLEGKDLEAHLFHNNLSAIDFGAKEKVGSSLLTVLPVALFLFIFIELRTGHKISLFALTFILLFYVSVFFNFFILGLYKNDVFFGFLGFRNYISDKRRLFRSVFVILGAACIFGAVLASDNALVKIRIKERTVPISVEQGMQVAPYELMEFSNPAIDFAKAFPERKRIIPEWFWDLLFGIIKWGAVGALTIGVLTFLIKPFFSAHWKQFWKEGRLLKFLRHILSELRQFLRFAFTHTAADTPYATVQSKKFGEDIKAFLKKAGRSKEKNAEIDRLTKHFMKLIDWGESHEIKYVQTLAPAEYTALFKNEKADLVGQLFEKALYDKNILTSEEEKTFIDSIKEIICG